MQDSPHAHERVVDDFSYGLRYNTLKQILLTAAGTFFTLSQQHCPRNFSVQNETIRLPVCEGRCLGRLVFVLRAGHAQLQALCCIQPWAQQYRFVYQAHLRTSARDITFLDFLRSIRRSIAKLRYQAEMDYLLIRFMHPRA